MLSDVVEVVGCKMDVGMPPVEPAKGTSVPVCVEDEAAPVEVGRTMVSGMPPVEPTKGT